jgi:hypothetical protein
MARFTVRLDDEAEDDPGTWVEREAERRDRTKAWVIREAVNAASDAGPRRVDRGEARAVVPPVTRTGARRTTFSFNTNPSVAIAAVCRGKKRSPRLRS